ncbi:hypothetical protein PoMZ_12141 [Pyricularia oryzae]|uniref:Uncharacterized protein n=1 Tax=Pyricularia oryzae TaxID=318829 RepID=A0A4P7NM37_PYROR|nr:hypothetical protein PoMZ_12141 [Pyricularia oryzae]
MQGALLAKYFTTSKKHDSWKGCVGSGRTEFCAHPGFIKIRATRLKANVWIF